MIPVIDLKNGLPVQAVKGERKTYAPVKSLLTPKKEAIHLARAMLEATSAPSIYLADLDAISGLKGHGELIKDLAGRLPSGLWVDAGAAEPAKARAILKLNAQKAIICSEALKSLEDLNLITSTLDLGKILFSLDIKNNCIMTAQPGILGDDPIKALQILWKKGFDSFILMTLDQVGTGKGPDWRLLEKVRQALPQARLIAAGGVRDMDSLKRLTTMGMDAALVATCLHKGWVKQKDLRELKKVR